jgi:hypothetical protein
MPKASDNPMSSARAEELLADCISQLCEADARCLKAWREALRRRQESLDGIRRRALKRESQR